MGWLSAILNPPSRRIDGDKHDVWTDQSAWTPLGGVSELIGGKRPAAGIPVDHNSAMNCAAALACTRAVAETLATLPALIFENIDAVTREKARLNPMWRLLHDKPNPDMDAVTYYGMQTKRLVNRGNAFSLIEYNERDEPIALWPVHNSRIRPHKEKSTVTNSGRYRPGALTYRLYMLDDPSAYYTLDPRYVLNIVGFDSEDGVTACGVVPRAKEEISLDTAAQEFSGSVYGNGALPLGLVKHPGWIPDETKRENFRRDINTLHQGREKWNRVGIMWENAEWVKLGFSPEEVQSLAGRTLTAKMICMYYGVPPAIVQIFDDYKFSSVEAMLKQFVMLTIRPYAVRWEQAVGAQLMSQIPDDIFLEFALEGLLRGDPLSQAQANALMRQWGVISTNEWRRQFNWNPVDGGDKRIVPMNYTTLESAGANPKANPNADSARDSVQLPHFDPQAIGRLNGNGRLRAPRIKPCKQPSIETYSVRVINDAIGRLAKTERRAIARAVERLDATAFLPWLDQFHDKFRGALGSSLRIGVAGWLPVDRQADIETCSGQVADVYIEASRSRILAACECQPDQLAASVVAALENWPPLRVTGESLKGLSDAA